VAWKSRYPIVGKQERRTSMACWLHSIFHPFIYYTCCIFLPSSITLICSYVQAGIAKIGPCGGNGGRPYDVKVWQFAVAQSSIHFHIHTVTILGSVTLQVRMENGNGYLISEYAKPVIWISVFVSVFNVVTKWIYPKFVFQCFSLFNFRFVFDNIRIHKENKVSWTYLKVFSP
jgi:hypothetical protein